MEYSAPRQAIIRRRTEWCCGCVGKFKTHASLKQVTLSGRGGWTYRSSLDAAFQMPERCVPARLFHAIVGREGNSPEKVDL